MRSAKTLLPLIALTLIACPGSDGDGESDTDGGTTGFDAGQIEPGTVTPGDPCNGTVDCTPGSICFSNICVQDGTLRFSLSWTVDTDFDLHVITPAGNEISFSERMYDGGELDVDDCVAGDCTLPDYTHVENVFFIESAEHGEYTYWVRNYDKTQSGEFSLVAAKDGVVQMTHNGTLPSAPEDSLEDVDSERFTFTY